MTLAKKVPLPETARGRGSASMLRTAVAEAMVTIEVHGILDERVLNERAPSLKRIQERPSTTTHLLRLPRNASFG